MKDIILCTVTEDVRYLKSHDHGNDIQVFSTKKGVETETWHSVHTHLEESFYEATKRVFEQIAEEHHTKILPILVDKN